ncbi:Argonaute-binding protein [Paramyrothecium foliicola]|nr:Argonaute-binding protein [Paramyrothecium foliicola]
MVINLAHPTMAQDESTPLPSLAGKETQPPETQPSPDAELQDPLAKAGGPPVLPGKGDGSAPSKKKKNKRSKKTTASRGPTALPKGRGTGFEEYYADPPMTPAEALEEKSEIYAERIQACIQRYRSRRRLRPDQAQYFNEYLFLGGIDTSANAFAGQDLKELKGLTPAQRREVLATDTVHGGSAAGERFFTGDLDHWSVDFTGVAAGFLSSNVLASLTGCELKELEAGISLVENFLRYVLQHDVCPEYEEDVKQAVELCGVARHEWPKLVGLQTALPGQFNLAASELFCQQEEDDWFLPPDARPEGFDASSVFLSSVALIENGDVFTCVSKPGVKVVHQFDCTLQIGQILRPTGDVIQRFQQLRLDSTHPNIPPLGKIICKQASIEDGWDHPSLPSPLRPRDHVELYFDDTVLVNMKQGMRMSLTLCELDGGFRFVKTIQKVVPSFYTFLPQELMRHFKAPREDDRPAPSVHNPADGDEEAGDEAKVEE